MNERCLCRSQRHRESASREAEEMRSVFTRLSTKLSWGARATNFSCKSFGFVCGGRLLHKSFFFRLCLKEKEASSFVLFYGYVYEGEGSFFLCPFSFGYEKTGTIFLYPFSLVMFEREASFFFALFLLVMKGNGFFIRAFSFGYEREGRFFLCPFLLFWLCLKGKEASPFALFFGYIGSKM